MSTDGTEQTKWEKLLKQDHVIEAGSQALFGQAGQPKCKRYEFTNLLLYAINGFTVGCFIVSCDHAVKAYIQQISQLQRKTNYY